MMWWFLFSFLFWMTANVMAGLFLVYLAIETLQDPEAARRLFSPRDRNLKHKD